MSEPERTPHGRIVVTLRARLAPYWATAEEFAGMTDEQIIELVQEDVIALLDDCDWSVERPPAAPSLHLQEEE
jgi:hypothetical protein